MPKYKVEFEGIDEVLNTLGKRAKGRLNRRIADDLREGVETMAETSYDYAPVETGALRSSILASVKREKRLQYIYGSHLPYAQRQEYEHNGKQGGDLTPRKGYFRRAVWKEQPQLGAKIGFTVKRTFS